MRRLPWIAVAAIFVSVGYAPAADWYAAPDGEADAAGTQELPWDLESALQQAKIAPGDTLWLAAGSYRHPDRKLGSPGYVVRLAGEEGKPIVVRGEPGARVTVDGGLTVQAPSTCLWVRDLEILTSENLTMSREVAEPGSHPKEYGRPWGGLNVYAGQGCKFINLVIHDNAQGVSWWKGSTDSELYGCIIYDNGWKAPDRGHGHAVYTQNQDGVKTIADCIMTGGYSYTMHAYGSSNAYVDNFLIENNIAYDGGTFLVGGGRPSRGIRVLNNYLYNVGMQIGYNAPHNEDCEVRGNVIVNGGLSVNRFNREVREGNLVLGRGRPRPEGDARIELLPNRYDPRRAYVVVYNWSAKPTIELPADKLSVVLKPGDRYRLASPRDLYGKPVLSATFNGRSIRVPMAGEFAALVLLAE